jgi:hypothetical protein
MTQAAQLAQYGANNVGLSFKNRIINGDMTISQRNGTTAVTCAQQQSTFGVDRFSVYRDNASATITIGQSTNAPAGFTNSSIFSVTTGSSPTAANECQFRHVIEGFNVADFGFGTANAQTVTLSFWVRSSLTGTFAVAFQNSGSGLSYVTTYTISAANTWEQKSVSFTGPSTGTWVTNNGTGLVCIWDLGGGSNFNATTNTWTAGNVYTTAGTTKVIGTTGATWQVTGVQLEKGTVATSFDYLPYTTELALCQRYCFKASGNTSDIPGYSFTTYSSSSGVVNVPFPVTMRAAPSFTLSGTARIQSVSDSSDFTSGLVVSGATPTGAGLALSGTANMTANASGHLQFRATNSSLLFTAEL